MITLKRRAIAAALNNVTIEKPILLPYSEEEIIELFFDKREDGNGNTFFSINRIILEIQGKIDFSNVPFDNVKMSGINLSRAYGVRFNPQKIYGKSLEETTLSKDAEVIGNDNVNQKDLFEGVKVIKTKFNGCKNVRINPQTIFEKNLSYAVLKGVDFTGFSFDECNIWDTDFSGSKGAKLNPNKVFNANYAKLANVELTDLPENVDRYSNYSGSNYNELLDLMKKHQDKFLESIEEQLPPQVKEEPNQTVELPKQKRKWFGNN